MTQYIYKNIYAVCIYICTYIVACTDPSRGSNTSGSLGLAVGGKHASAKSTSVCIHTYNMYILTHIHIYSTYTYVSSYIHIDIERNTHLLMILHVQTVVQHVLLHGLCRACSRLEELLYKVWVKDQASNTIT